MTLGPEDMEKDTRPETSPGRGGLAPRAEPLPAMSTSGNIVQEPYLRACLYQSGGVMYLRIEDTDTKREVKGAGA